MVIVLFLINFGDYSLKLSELYIVAPDSGQVALYITHLALEDNHQNFSEKSAQNSKSKIIALFLSFFA